MISHIVSVFSGKPVFGQDGLINNLIPYYLLDSKSIFVKHTICRKESCFILLLLYLLFY